MRSEGAAAGRRTLALFCMRQRGHFQRVRSVAAALVSAGARALVFTHADFAAEVASAGAEFRDLFAGGRPEDAGDRESAPRPARFTTFAGRYADAVAAEVAASGATLVLYDTFAVIGRAVARRLGLPHVNLCAGHAVIPADVPALVAALGGHRASPLCLEVVEALRARFGLEDASPLSFGSAPGAALNVYFEPPAFLDEGSRAALEPIAFWGAAAAPNGGRAPIAGGAPRPREAAEGPLRALVSFGTVVWTYPLLRARALRLLGSLAEAISPRGDVRMLVSLGGAAIDAEARRALERPHVRIETYIDQRLALGEADVLVTHHGLNSTHEAICAGVPMLSCPFVWDQPALARTCAALGVALPFAAAAESEVAAARVAAALDRLRRERESLAEALANLQRIEGETARNRPAVIERILSLA